MNRDKYIDIAKGIGIIAVLVGHLSVDMIVINILYVFHMPLFFYISGIYVKKRIFIEWLFKNKSLIYYYLLFGMLFSVIGNMNTSSEIISDIISLFKSSTTSVWEIRWFGPFWFILSLLFIRFIWNQFSFINSIYLSIIVFYLSYILNFEYSNFLLYAPFALGPALMMLLFFNLGKHHHKIIKYYSLRNLIVISIIFIILNFILIYSYDGFSEKLVNYQRMYVSYPLIFAILMGMIGIITTFFISKMIEEKMKKFTLILSYLGKHSLLIFALHIFFYSMSGKIMRLINMDFMLVSSPNMTKFILSIVCTTIIIESIAYIKKRFK